MDPRDLEPPRAEPHGHAHHHPFLQHHFEDMGQQHEASTLGMWFFVAQEILFFGGIFCAYFIYREMYPAAWSAGSKLQHWQIGAVNTVVLIGSSLTMAFGVRAAQTNHKRATVNWLILTVHIPLGVTVILLLAALTAAAWKPAR